MLGKPYTIRQMKSVALFDFDNTLYDGFSYFDLLAKQTDEGLVTADALPNANDAMRDYRSGATDYEATIVRLLDIYATGLEGKTYADVYGSAHEFYQNSQKVYGFARKVFALLRPTHDICLVTGEPQFIAESIAEIYDLDGQYSTIYAVEHGVLTGGVASYLATRHEKHNAISHLLQGHQVKNSFAFGDSEGDMEMLAAVENPICINPTPGLYERAAQKGWPCVAPDEAETVVKKLLA